MIKAIVFDFDGTIIDTETAWYSAFRELYKQHGVDLSLELYSGCIGTSLHTFNPYEYLITEHRLPIDREAFRQEVRLRHAALMEREEMRRGIRSYLDQAKEAGLKIGLATSSEKAWVDRFLPRLGIADYFDCVRTADDVVNVKPDPELYVRTLECLGVAPEEAVAIEDSPNGAKAAAAAGMHCVVVPNAITQYLQFDAPNYKLGCLTELEFNVLMGNPVGS